MQYVRNIRRSKIQILEIQDVRHKKCINAGYGACVRSMIPHYTQIMQSPSLLHAAGLRTNKTTSGDHPPNHPPRILFGNKRIFDNTHPTRILLGNKRVFENISKYLGILILIYIHM